MAADRVLEEVHSAAGVLPDREAERVRRHPHQLRAGSLLPHFVDPVPEALRHRLLGIGVEVPAEGTGQADDVAGDIEPAARNLSLGDAVPHCQQRRERTPGVEHGGEAVGEPDLGRLRDQLLEPAFVAGQELDRDAVDQMDVGIHEPGDHVLPLRRNDPGLLRDPGRGRGADGYDLATDDDNRGVADGVATSPVDDRGAGDDGGVLCGQRRGDGEQARGKKKSFHPANIRPACELRRRKAPDVGSGVELGCGSFEAHVADGAEDRAAVEWPVEQAETPQNAAI